MVCPWPAVDSNGWRCSLGVLSPEGVMGAPGCGLGVRAGWQEKRVHRALGRADFRKQARKSVVCGRVDWGTQGRGQCHERVLQEHHLQGGQSRSLVTFGRKIQQSRGDRSQRATGGEHADYTRLGSLQGKKAGQRHLGCRRVSFWGDRNQWRGRGWRAIGQWCLPCICDPFPSHSSLS